MGARDVELVACTKLLAREGKLLPDLLSALGVHETLRPVPMMTIGELFVVGPTHHLIGHLPGGFECGAFVMDKIQKYGSAPTAYHSLWSVDAGKQRAMVVRPTHYGEPASARAKIENVLATRSVLFYQRNMRWTSQALLAAETERPVMGGSSWLGLLHEDEAVRFAASVWCNSLLGMLVHWDRGSRSHLGRSRTQVEAISEMPVPDFSDPRYLDRARRVLASQGELLRRAELRPACLAFSDPVRRHFDECVIAILGWPADIMPVLDDLRWRWCNEPSVHGNGKRIEAKRRKWKEMTDC